MITVINKKQLNTNSATTIYCGRGSPLGNVFRMNSESMRDAVCDKYDSWFHEMLKGGDVAVTMAVNNIISKAADGDISLECYCAPKRCHCDTIKKFVDATLEKLK